MPAKDAPKILKGKLEEDDDKADEEHVCIYNCIHIYIYLHITHICMYM